MQCNIDAKGKAARLISGIITTLIGLVLLALLLVDVLSPTWWLWTLAVIALMMGAFQIYEGRKGWCVMRALGFRTPM